MLCYVVNMLSASGGDSKLDVHKTMSLIGYCQIPTVMFAALAIVLPRTAAMAVGSVFVLWSARMCSSLILSLVPELQDQRGLVMYPCALIFSAFGLLTVY
mmetsp:Transcript_14651/g.46622  ORF Transcript_14651/g.46622 Transcript_14651/m.46622 type:complete len:100 (-) Transcript_14651:77-376(-)